MSSGVILLQRPYISFKFSSITDSKAGDNRCGSGLVFSKKNQIRIKLTGTLTISANQVMFCWPLFICCSVVVCKIPQKFWKEVG